MNYLLPQRLDRLARDYAVGTLAGPARRRFERVVCEQAQAAAAVAAWQERLTVLAAGIPGAHPSAAVWQHLEQRLFPAPRRSGARRELRSWFSGPLWAGALVGALLCAVVLREEPSWLGLEPRAESLPPSYVGLLVDTADQATLLASSRRHGRSLTVKLLRPLVVPTGQTAWLWALPRNGSAPFAVGPVPNQGAATLALPDSAEKLFFEVGRLALSVEAVGAIPTAPTSPFVAAGHCVKLW